VDLKTYYEYYLTLHQNVVCRRLHFIGQWVTILYVATVVYNSIWIALALAPVIIYPFAWAGHVFYEKNKPAAFSDPLKAKISDWLMFRDILLGKIKIW